MSKYTNRASAREALLALAPDLADALDALRRFDVLADDTSFLGRATVRLALDAFVQCELSAELLERWAEAVHSAEDVELDSADQEFLSEALFELSTPELFGSMEEIVAGLRDRDRGPGDG